MAFHEKNLCVNLWELVVTILMDTKDHFNDFFDVIFLETLHINIINLFGIQTYVLQIRLSIHCLRTKYHLKFHI